MFKTFLKSFKPFFKTIFKPFPKLLPSTPPLSLEGPHLTPPPPTLAMGSDEVFIHGSTLSKRLEIHIWLRLCCLPWKCFRDRATAETFRKCAIWTHPFDTGNPKTRSLDKNVYTFQLSTRQRIPVMVMSTISLYQLRSISLFWGTGKRFCGIHFYDKSYAGTQ